MKYIKSTHVSNTIIVLCLSFSHQFLSIHFWSLPFVIRSVHSIRLCCMYATRSLSTFDIPTHTQTCFFGIFRLWFGLWLRDSQQTFNFAFHCFHEIRLRGMEFPSASHFHMVCYQVWWHVLCDNVQKLTQRNENKTKNKIRNKKNQINLKTNILPHGSACFPITNSNDRTTKAQQHQSVSFLHWS